MGVDKLGVSLNSSDIQKGLRELNPDISFDAVENRPSEYRYVLKGADNMAEQRGSVYFRGKFATVMDRGVTPENPIYSTALGWEEISMAEIESHDDTKVLYIEILEDDPFYHQALTKAQAKDDNYRIDDDGRVFRYQALRERQVPDKVMTVGWRRTLSDLACVGIPGITIDTIYEKFRVRL